jgi:hypothetical protein
MTEIRIEDLPELFSCIAKIFVEKKDELCAMDANMGDGDLGLTMSKGYSAMPDIIRANTVENNIGKTLFKAGMKMASVVPSTMGTLTASGIMEAGKSLNGKDKIQAADLAVFFESFAAGIKKRGKCEAGDRTIYDAIFPAGKEAKKVSDGSILEVAGAALQGAEAGVEATKDMLPKFGKAAVFASKAKGVADQGAVAGYLMVKGVYLFLESKSE